MRVSGVILVLLVLAGLAGPGARAQSQPSLRETAQEAVGDWELSNADRDRRCVVGLKPDAAPGGMKIELGPDCAAAFPLTKDVVAWKVTANQALQFLDAGGRMLLEFTEVESGMYEGERRGEGLFFLQNLAAARSAAPALTTEQMIGEWLIVRGDRPVCALTLSSKAAGSGAFGLGVKPGCDQAVARFAPKSWVMDRGELVLNSGRGETWRFEEIDDKTWQRVPEGTEPLLMVRQ